MQRVEQEVRLELRAQHVQPRLGELAGEVAAAIPRRRDSCAWAAASAAGDDETVEQEIGAEVAQITPCRAAASTPPSAGDQGSRLSEAPMSAPPTITNAAAPRRGAATPGRARAGEPRIRIVAAASGGVSRAQGHQLASWPATIR